MKERVIVWRITQTCNMNCRFCSYSNEVERLRSDADEAEITRLCGVLADYKQRTGDDLLVSWIGGEPLLWDQLLKHSAFLHENGVRVSTTTNGLLLGRRDIQEGILRHFSEIVCSLDGYETCNDDVRQHRGHFQLVSKHIRELAGALAKGYDACILFVAQMRGANRLTPNDETHPAFGEALREAAKQGVHIRCIECDVRVGEVTVHGELPVVL